MLYLIEKICLYNDLFLEKLNLKLNVTCHLDLMVVTDIYKTKLFPFLVFFSLSCSFPFQSLINSAKFFYLIAYIKNLFK